MPALTRWSSKPLNSKSHSMMSIAGLLQTGGQVEVPDVAVDPGVREPDWAVRGRLGQGGEHRHRRVADQRHRVRAERPGGRREPGEELRAAGQHAADDGQPPAALSRRPHGRPAHRAAVRQSRRRPLPPRPDPRPAMPAAPRERARPRRISGRACGPAAGQAGQPGPAPAGEPRGQRSPGGPPVESADGRTQAAQAEVERAALVAAQVFAAADAARRGRTVRGEEPRAGAAHGDHVTGVGGRGEQERGDVVGDDELAGQPGRGRGAPPGCPGPPRPGPATPRRARSRAGGRGRPRARGSGRKWPGRTAPRRAGHRARIDRRRVPPLSGGHGDRTTCCRPRRCRTAPWRLGHVPAPLIMLSAGRRRSRRR